MVTPYFTKSHGAIKMTEATYPIENDSFLNLLDELRDELEMISTTNALTSNVEGDDDIENAVMKSLEIVDTIAADFVNKQNTNTSGLTHVSKALPTNTLNNDVLYVGINSRGFACVFNYLSVYESNNIKTFNCYYIDDKERHYQMNGLVWWKVLERPTFQDFYEEGFAAYSSAFITKRTINSNPYPKNTQEHQHWLKGWMTAAELPF